MTSKSTDQDYSEAGFGKGIGMGDKPALLMIDFINAYFDKSSPLYAGVEAELAVAAKLLAAARAAGVPVIHTRVAYSKDGADGGYFLKKVEALNLLRGGGPLSDIHDDVAPLAGEVVFTKQYASGFFGTGMASTMSYLGCDTAIVAGLTTSGCVRATALDALQHGFRPIVVADACGDRDEGVQKANLFDLNAKYADVVASHFVLKHLAE